MENSTQPSSSISITSSSHLSNVSSNKVYSEAELNLKIISLRKLSYNLGHLLSDFGSDLCDANIVVEEETSVGIHRCILAARSTFFNDLFRKDKGCVGEEGKPKYYVTSLLPYGKIGYEAFVIFLNYLYKGKLRPSPLEVSTCVDIACVHDACGPAIDFAVELMCASTVFQVNELVSLFQRRLVNLVSKAVVDDIIPILTIAFHCQLSQLLTQCVDRIARSDLDAMFIEKVLPAKVMEDITELRLNYQVENRVDPLHEKQVKRIYRALDSDDIELVRLLLTESDITLDNAFALHYAVAYCDPKIVSEVLSLGLADVNLRNTRGYTVLHVASRRKEPSIIVSLLAKGACASEGQSALNICKRMTRPKEYQMKRENGQEGSKDRICIDVLEREMRRNPVVGDAWTSSLTMADDDLHMKLFYLEDRVAFARMFFPGEAKVAMEIAHAETTLELAGLLSSRVSSGSLMEVDLNESPTCQKRRLISRMETLSRSVELGRRYFPDCSQVLDKFMEDDLPEAFYLEKGTPEEQEIKRIQFMKLMDQVHKAFDKDTRRSGFS